MVQCDMAKIPPDEIKIDLRSAIRYLRYSAFSILTNFVGLRHVAQEIADVGEAGA